MNESRTFTRRRLLAVLGGGAAAAAGARYLSPSPHDRLTTAGLMTPGSVGPAADPNLHRLVVIEMSGGCDGLSLAVPFGDPRYYDLRARTAVTPDEVLKIDDRVGLHPALTRLHGRGVAVVEGVGAPNPDESHFAMLDRWWSGDTEGRAALATGFLGRVCDAISDPSAAATGITIGSGPSRALVADRATTLSLPDLATTAVLAPSDDPALTAFGRAYEAMVSGGGGLDPVDRARRAGRDALRFAAVAAPAASNPMSPYPDLSLASSLQLAATLLAADPGIRVIHVAFGDFDTHDSHTTRFQAGMDELDQSVDAFLADLEARGLTDTVLVGTTSEFGRRGPDNGSNGLDHGAASTMLLAGPVAPGLHGEPSSLAKLDENDNLVATVRIDEYLAVLATWLGVNPSAVLPGDPGPVAGVLA
jgi:uncharacterized protein (DUF1501 family)